MGHLCPGRALGGACLSCSGGSTTVVAAAAALPWMHAGVSLPHGVVPMAATQHSRLRRCMSHRVLHCPVTVLLLALVVQLGNH